MPTFKGVTVEIRCPNTLLTDSGNMIDPHVEYFTAAEHGTYKLRKTNKVTCYIPAVTNSPFGISISMLDSYELLLKGYDQEVLVAYIYFDGNAEAEVAVVVHQGVTKLISTTWINAGDGQLEERAFIFREVGLENVFRSLDISSKKRSAPDADVPNRTARSAANAIDGFMERRKEVAGQIRVEVFRAKCLGPGKRGDWGTRFNERMAHSGSAQSDIGGKRDVSHTTGYRSPEFPQSTFQSMLTAAGSRIQSP
jgi:hypothetical protein